MVVLITVVDAAIAPTSVAFAKMLKRSLDYRRLETHSIFADQPQTILDLSSGEAVNSEFTKDLASQEATYHIDIRSLDTEGLESSIASLDFIIAQAHEVSDDDLNETVVNTLQGFSESKEKPLQYNNLYPAIYASLVLKVPTITIILNEASVHLFRSAADELAEIVEQTAHHRTD